MGEFLTKQATSHTDGRMKFFSLSKSVALAERGNSIEQGYKDPEMD